MLPSFIAPTTHRKWPKPFTRAPPSTTRCASCISCTTLRLLPGWVNLRSFECCNFKTRLFQLKIRTVNFSFATSLARSGLLSLKIASSIDCSRVLRKWVFRSFFFKDTLFVFYNKRFDKKFRTVIFSLAYSLALCVLLAPKLASSKKRSDRSRSRPETGYFRTNSSFVTLYHNLGTSRYFFELFYLYVYI
jgi:hypothetical protein